MRGLAWTLAVFAFVALPPAAAAGQPRANPVPSEPTPTTAGEPIDIVFALSGVGSGVRNDVAVVIRGRPGEESFPAIPLGSGRYRTTATFPYGGEGELRVGYGHGETIPLGKGGIRMNGPPPPKRERAAPATRPATVAGAFALLLGLSGLAVVASRFASRGSPALPG